MAKAQKKPVKIVSDALTLVNRIRKFEGKKPLKQLPKGQVQNAYACPLGNALDNEFEVDEEHLEVPLSLGLYLIKQNLALPADDYDCITITTPKALARFVAWFDAQETPAARALSEEVPND